jgi:flagellar biogenesis protein FliO
MRVLLGVLTAVATICLAVYPALAAHAAGPALAAAADADGSGARQPVSPGAGGSAPPLGPQAATSRGANRDPGGWSSVLTIGGSLAVVLAGFLVVAWALRRASPGGFGALPPEVFEVLGRAALAHRHQAQLLRCGNKLLLVAVTTDGATTLAEITDPAEVERLATACRRGRRRSGPALGRAFRRGEERNG